MNYKAVLRINAQVILIETVLMTVPLIICMADGDSPGFRGFAAAMIIGFVLSGAALWLTRKAKNNIGARDGFFAVGLAWTLMSLLGALPLFVSNSIPSYVDAFFEIVSGFTTTGASIIPGEEIASLSRGILYWRSFTHWLGGMGMLVLLLAVIPQSGRNGGFSLHILRAESPGPSVGKLVPKMRQTAMILYFCYFALTFLDTIFLVASPELSLFDALCLAYGTAGTGGFGLNGHSIGGYSPYVQNVCTVFMYLFGVNFTLYYYLLMRRVSYIFKDEELRMYLATITLSITVIMINLWRNGIFSTFGERLRHAAFQVASVMTTTGYTTTDFNEWPSLSKGIMVCLMFMGACAGSTGGGIKIMRVLLLGKTIRRNTHSLLHPREVKAIRYNGGVVDERVIENVQSYMAIYVAILIFSFILISMDGRFSVLSNATAVISALNNIGPGLEQVGPSGNFAGYSVFSKLVLCFDMLAGRLEIFPMLVFFSRSTWKKV
ncbi:MAG: TrkH family potassium uptake protein [Clostridia bacterium]|nr:TrkH family potassium uptake protein [Clostridia bacterium]